MDEKIYNRLLFYFVNSVMENYREISGSTLGKPQIEDTKEEALVCNGCVALLSFKGKFSGRVVIVLTEAIAQKITEGLTMEKCEKISQTVLFSVAEFLNIVTGRALSLFNNEFKEMRILPSPPSVFYGKELKFVNFKIKGFNVVFSEDGGIFKLNIGIMEDKNG